MLLLLQVRALTMMGLVRRRLVELRDDERGDVYSTTIMVAVGVVIAIAVGAILLAKFTGKANDIDVDTPTAG